MNENIESEEYVSLIVYDYRNQCLLKDYSIRPSNFANYHIESKLPLDMSPIFFNAEVLDKYRYNPDKYKLCERTISCKGCDGWYLQTYDINEGNQVHTYPVYLRTLPYKEQLHWKVYNEEPKGGISKKAFKTDIMGEFPDEEPKLNRLKRILKSFSTIKLQSKTCDIGPLWSPKGDCWESASKGLFFVKTENANQWHDFIIALSNTVIEGLQTNNLKKVAKYYGNKDSTLKSLGLLKFIIQKTSNEKCLSETWSVLSDLNKKRGQGKAHGYWSTPNGSFIKDAEKRLDDVIKAIERLIKIFSDIQL